MAATVVGVAGAMAATVGEAVPAGIIAAAPATAAGVVGTGAAWARRTSVKEEATAGLLGENRAARTRVGWLVITPRAHPPTLRRGRTLGHLPLTSKWYNP